MNKLSSQTLDSFKKYPAYDNYLNLLYVALQKILHENWLRILLQDIDNTVDNTLEQTVAEVIAVVE